VPWDNERNQLLLDKFMDGGRFGEFHIHNKLTNFNQFVKLSESFLNTQNEH
jgi:hypothetical protein